MTPTRRPDGPHDKRRTKPLSRSLLGMPVSAEADDQGSSRSKRQAGMSTTETPGTPGVPRSRWESPKEVDVVQLDVPARRRPDFLATPPGWVPATTPPGPPTCSCTDRPLAPGRPLESDTPSPVEPTLTPHRAFDSDRPLLPDPVQTPGAPLPY